MSGQNTMTTSESCLQLRHCYMLTLLRAIAGIGTLLSLQVTPSPLAFWAIALGITFCLWAFLTFLVVCYWRTQARRLWPLALAIDLALCVAVNLLFAPLPSSLAAAAFLLPAYGWAIAYGVVGALIVLLTFCWSELIIALLRLSTNQPPASWLSMLLWFLVISLTAGLHLLLRRRRHLLAFIFSNQSNSPLQLGSPAFQLSESLRPEATENRESASLQSSLSLSPYCGPNVTLASGSPLIHDTLPGVQVPVLLAALETAFAAYGVKLDQHRQRLESALEALKHPHMADPAQFACCLRCLLQEAEYNWQQRAALSAREWELLNLLAEGLSYRQIGQRLYLSPSTVKTHMRNLQQKLGVSGKEKMLRLARARGWIKDQARQ
ncbi:LuxR C-terminal-related transcriptional regulator [Thermogemmatispora tikiterensis]|uniref:HTH luxR-type domain-containing protein n=1 Tax=Thermogemmatispora tikiterensis TaxID=1825093 RepID=A0A328VLB8_9CHLR|nr:LuxR C-terminal-related transcriptional regulator [Thermogemmatispora tikiterensis]RAQ95904.1 hypothetical protein A4R35_10185 [Thermogemmatispora tikiterensis]